MNKTLLRFAWIPFVSGFFCAPAAVRAEPGDRADAISAYSDVLSLLQQGQLSLLCQRYVRANTAFGFGPGEEGCSGLRRVLGAQRSCRKAVIRALEQGCRLEREASCVFPPYDGDNVIYLGARGHLQRDEKTKQWYLRSAICGGD